jgi:hypothetical protein
MLDFDEFEFECVSRNTFKEYIEKANILFSLDTQQTPMIQIAYNLYKKDQLHPPTKTQFI